MKHPLALALAVALTSVAVTACKPSAEKPAATKRSAIATKVGVRGSTAGGASISIAVASPRRRRK